MQEPRTLKATSHVQVNNDWVRVTEWRFEPGADTGHHVHEYDYVVVPMTTGVLRLEEPGGVRDASLQAGVSYARSRGVTHNVINANDFEFRFIEIELLRPTLAP
jgi:quercetin dioxygenase-like cupin family protein